jgi:flagellar biosynthesis/type III secretory pathway M-ring protein FliF/YscJ
MWLFTLLSFVIVIVILVIIREILFPTSSEDEKKEEQYEKWQKLDKELEDYDYLNERR